MSYKPAITRSTALALFLSTSAGVAGPTDSMNVASLARAASRFAAIKAFCPEAIPTNKVQADKFVDLYGTAGERIAGSAAWSRRITGEVARRIKEVKITGLQRWCEDQRRYLREVGEKTVFP